MPLFYSYCSASPNFLTHLIGSSSGGNVNPHLFPNFWVCVNESFCLSPGTVDPSNEICQVHWNICWILLTNVPCTGGECNNMPVLKRLIHVYLSLELPFIHYGLSSSDMSLISSKSPWSCIGFFQEQIRYDWVLCLKTFVIAFKLKPSQPYGATFNIVRLL